MKITFEAGKNFVITEAIKNYAETKLSKMEKHFDNLMEIRVKLSAVKTKTGPIQTAEARAHINGNIIKGVATEPDLYAAIDRVEEILQKQITKHKEKLRDDRHTLPKAEKKIVYNEENEVITMESVKNVVNISLDPRPMDLEEAILQLETLEKDFYVFTNAETGTMNVVYKKRNGDYGHIEPEIR
ncbi:MAG: ribosome-associated translation inhibitor RaiA [Cetobacterium sp.]|uniref:ribosome hibernation-promoting factor, HPF/YfiA family n=1 Tax=unclassified Cetobacterium TaxID=2630983 RepID=UPI00163C1829|nr:ribosome-associated translation inhibitor RaiA [Cetobacterium sp. 2A]MBC2855845.1 ribosome-associated translation inhibitor RaiA [Cetobacterium sp. 2A]